jgi:hypothetical protein
MGQLTTDTISVYTTVCPVEATPEPTESAFVIGFLVTIVIDVTVEAVVNKISGLTGQSLLPAFRIILTLISDTLLVTETILSETASLYNTAKEGQRTSSDLPLCEID